MRNRRLLFQFVLFIILWYAIFHRPKPQSLETVVMTKHRNYVENSRIEIHLKRELEKPFKLLFWTRWYDNLVSDDENTFKYRNDCRSEFILTSNRSQLSTADAIIFSLMDLPWNKRKVDYIFPHHRNPDVPWILAVTEASNYYPDMREDFDGIFNWTWSSRTDSEFHVTYRDLFTKLETPDERWLHGSTFSDQFLRQKKKVAAWVASNCELVISNRQQLVNELSKCGIGIDVYGKCGNKHCGNGIDCFRKLGNKYKFYFAFENSLCVDYSTEKIYNALYHGMIPIVYGLGNWSVKAPKGSWIDVMDYKTVEDLANYIRHLDNDPISYMKYFEWRMYYGIVGTFDSKYHCSVWKQIRDRTYLVIQGEERCRHVYDYLKTWYHFFHNPTSGLACRRCAQLLEQLQNPQEIRDSVHMNEENCV
ncbi:unnamed protein product [Orchesella dallaii]|uniref:Fucosyltransferase n=1 Tax=Orchesella dallaii TaxID=48710 RepID=A0ABP1Q487_9HEXA